MQALQFRINLEINTPYACAVHILQHRNGKLTTKMLNSTFFGENFRSHSIHINNFQMLDVDEDIE